MAADYVIVTDRSACLPSARVGARIYDPDDPPEAYRARYRFSIRECDRQERCIVAYVYDPTRRADMPFSVRLNGTEIASGHPRGGVKRGEWEVFDGHLLLEDNELEIWVLPSSSTSRGHIYFSDIVVWFKT